VLEVVEYGVTNFLWQRESRFTTAFAFDKKATVIPVDVGKPQTGDVAGA
jgi:hypothetical protein